MPRPCCCRRIALKPACTSFGPRGGPSGKGGQIVLALDELEALRLADLEGLYQEEAARKMGVSRPTFARIVESARSKAARMLVFGEALRVAGGNVEYEGSAPRRCPSCRREGAQSGGLCCACRSRTAGKEEPRCGRKDPALEQGKKRRRSGGLAPAGKKAALSSLRENINVEIEKKIPVPGSLLMREAHGITRKSLNCVLFDSGSSGLGGMT